MDRNLGALKVATAIALTQPMEIYTNGEEDLMDTNAEHLAILRLKVQQTKPLTDSFFVLLVYSSMFCL